VREKNKKKHQKKGKRFHPACFAWKTVGWTEAKGRTPMKKRQTILVESGTAKIGMAQEKNLPPKKRFTGVEATHATRKRKGTIGGWRSVRTRDKGIEAKRELSMTLTGTAVRGKGKKGDSYSAAAKAYARRGDTKKDWLSGAGDLKKRKGEFHAQKSNEQNLLQRAGPAFGRGKKRSKQKKKKKNIKPQKEKKKNK